jgi:hypothetical protein
MSPRLSPAVMKCEQAKSGETTTMARLVTMSRMPLSSPNSTLCHWQQFCIVSRPKLLHPSGYLSTTRHEDAAGYAAFSHPALPLEAGGLGWG